MRILKQMVAKMQTGKPDHGRYRAGIRCLLFLAVSNLFLQGQILTVGNDTATPIAGAGHDYRQMLSETVSPSNGSLSVRISVPVPKDRGVSIPFSFNYDSAGLYHLFGQNGSWSWLSGSGYLSIGGWTYGIPLLSSVPLSYPVTVGNSPHNCPGYNDFIFTNPAGERHSLTELSWINSSEFFCPNSTMGNDDRYRGQVVNSSAGTIAVADHDGTIFTFDQA